jgi:hypothetical protein
MRYIAIDDLKPKPAWIRAATDAATAVRNARPENRSAVIEEHSDVR